MTKMKHSLFFLLVMTLALPLWGCAGEQTVALSTPAPVSSPTPATAREWFLRGNDLMQAGDLGNAVVAYKAAINLKEDYSDAYTNLGVAYYRQGDLTSAEQTLRKAVELAPKDAIAHYLLGITYLQSGQLEQAESYLQKANALDSKLPEVYYGLGALYKLQGKKGAAIAAFEHFLQVGPGQDPQAVNEAKKQLQELRGK